jgi:uncharacterized protein DUF4168
MQLAGQKIIAGILLAGFFLLPSAKPARAQELPKQQTSVNEDQLRAFAKVYVAVEKIRQTYEPRLKQAKDADEVKQIETQAANEMQAAAAKEGLTGESYRQIFDIANADEGLRQKVIYFINEEENKS